MSSNNNQNPIPTGSCSYHTHSHSHIGRPEQHNDQHQHLMSIQQMSNPNLPGPSRGGSFRCSGRCRYAAMATPTMPRHNHQNTTDISNPQLHANLSQQDSTFSYADFDNSQIHDVETTYPALLEKDIPGLRRSGIDTNAIRQHFYPDGGWGWIVCAVAFLAHVLTTGFQLSYGFLLLYAIKHLGHEVAVETEWIGSCSWAVSSLSTIFIIAICRRKSTRLMAVIGGLVLALGILFASFAVLFHQVAISYCLIVGIGASFVRDTAALTIESYFDRRRMFVEMVVMSGEGVGISLFSVIIKEGVGKLGWRLGLQVVTVLISTTFFMGMFYRPATQYHPHRSAILHIKSQRKKMKVKKTHIRTPKPPFIDFAPLKSPCVRMLCLTTAIAGLGIYTPIFFLSLHGQQAGCDIQDLVLLQTLLGLSLAIGMIIFSGSLINKQCQIASKKFIISHQHICQGCVLLVSISMLILSTLPPNFHTLCIVTFFYGLGFGGYRFSIKMLSLERIKEVHFSKTWGFIKAAESIPILISIPLIGLFNEQFQGNGRMGYFFCTAATAISVVLMFFIGYADIVTKYGSKYSNINGIRFDVSSDTRSSFRYNSDFYYSQNTSTSNANYSSSANQPIQNQHQLCQNNHTHNNQYSSEAINSNPGHQQTVVHNGGCGKLQKSLSFWFQSPDVMNEIYNNYSKCQNPTKKITNSPGSRSYTRCIHHAHHHQADNANHPTNNNLQVSRSRSVPDIVAHVSNSCLHNNYRTIGPQFLRSQSRPTVHFVEQLTTKV